VVLDDVLYDTFLGLDPAECAYERSAVVVVRAPYDGTTSYAAGARNGPAAIFAASTQVELHDLELERAPCEIGICALPTLMPSAAGPEAMIERVERVCGQAVQDGKLVLTIGGEHSVALGGARAAARRHGALSVLQIDAHLDLRDSYEGSRFSHACVARRLLELGDLVQVGVRTACPEELEVIAARGLRPIWGHELSRLSDPQLIDRVLSQLGPQVYVTLDVDGLDPSVIPATGTPVPGGLGWYQTLALLRAVGAHRRVVGCDLCELAPIPGQAASDFAAALLAYKMIGYFAPSPATAAARGA
jgi:agmatinase